MASKLRSVRESQKTYWVDKLGRRREELGATGLDEKAIEKDTVVKMLRAKVRETTRRLAAIAAREQKLEDMTRLREEKKAAPPKEKGKKAAPAMEEPQAKKKKKKEEGGEPVKKEAKKKAAKAEAAPAEPAPAQSGGEAE
ncbi:MAG: hypothetical protein WAR22_09535 [Desulfomonilia bacterium]|jgi:flagellar biosynthesis GTPase FlhF